MMDINIFSEEIGNLIASDKLEEAINKLQKLLKNTPKLDEAIIQSARYNDLTKQVRLGIIDFETANVSKNKIRYAILSLLNEIEGQYENNNEIKTELEIVFSKSDKPLNKQVHHGEGNNIIGENIVINNNYNKDNKIKLGESNHNFSNGQLHRDIDFCPELVFVEGGTFFMGHKGNVCEVILSSFNIGKYLVTFDEYEYYCKNTSLPFPFDENWGRGKRPVINITIEDSIKYCEWLSKKTGNIYRLPTEAEWEYAARGGSLSRNYKYSGSNYLENVGWYNKVGTERSLWTILFSLPDKEIHEAFTKPVGQKSPNELGLYDMSGNVYEMCSDFFVKMLPTQPQINPTGPLHGSPEMDFLHVLRGGSFNDVDVICELTGRHSGSLTKKNEISFRVVREI